MPNEEKMSINGRSKYLRLIKKRYLNPEIYGLRGPLLTDDFG